MRLKTSAAATSSSAVPGAAGWVPTVRRLRGLFIHIPMAAGRALDPLPAGSKFVGIFAQGCGDQVYVLIGTFSRSSIPHAFNFPDRDIFLTFAQG